jgi:glycerophosphoryl diester phosphodiesterase
MNRHNFNLREELLKTPIAHRGYFNAEHPENSLGAFARAVEHGFAVELDIQMTKDDVIVVFHDNDLKRVCGVDKKVKELTYAEIKELRLLDSNEGVPTFQEVLDVLDSKVLVVVEFKSVSGKNEILVDKAIEMLNAYPGKFVVQSFDPTIVRQLMKKAPEFRRGLLVGDMKETEYPAALRYVLSHMMVNSMCKPEFIDTDLNWCPRLMEKWHKQGKLLICYTARTLEQYEFAINKYDNVIFEQFDPVPLFQANRLNKK